MLCCGGLIEVQHTSSFCPCCLYVWVGGGEGGGVFFCCCFCLQITWHWFSVRIFHITPAEKELKIILASNIVPNLQDNKWTHSQYFSESASVFLITCFSQPIFRPLLTVAKYLQLQPKQIQAALAWSIWSTALGEQSSLKQCLLLKALWQMIKSVSHSKQQNLDRCQESKGPSYFPNHW